MDTPVFDFVEQYRCSKPVRLHMPGHKGRSMIGWEGMDLTEITGADSLYEANGIIAKSEENARSLFGSGGTFYSTEGSTQCVKAMLYLALQAHPGRRPVIVAPRNVHKSYVYAAALLDFETVWLWPEGERDSLCACPVSPKALEALLDGLSEPPAAVYVTSPDYLGGMADVQALGEVCRRHDTLLLVDNAHGAYLHFLSNPCHPMDLGADLCCDSAHKTLPVLTGGAYLHISEKWAKPLGELGKSALALFGSTSPSYLILASLDRCNHYLEGYRPKLEKTVAMLSKYRDKMRKMGWTVVETDPLRLVIKTPEGLDGKALQGMLEKKHIFTEYAEKDYLVLMVTPENRAGDLERVCAALGEIGASQGSIGARAGTMGVHEGPMGAMGVHKGPIGDDKGAIGPGRGLMGVHTGAMGAYEGMMGTHPAKQALSPRQALFSPHRTIPTQEALGRICAAPTVSCPPAIPVVVSGEVIHREAIEVLLAYGVETVEVVKEEGE